MKRFLLISLIFVTLIVDYAALDDITTGNQPNFFNEYVTLVVSVFILIYSSYLLMKEWNIAPKWIDKMVKNKR